MSGGGRGGEKDENKLLLSPKAAVCRWNPRNELTNICPVEDKDKTALWLVVSYSLTGLRRHDCGSSLNNHLPVPLYSLTQWSHWHVVGASLFRSEPGSYGLERSHRRSKEPPLTLHLTGWGPCQRNASEQTLGCAQKKTHGCQQKQAASEGPNLPCPQFKPTHAREWTLGRARSFISQRPGP